MDCIVHELSCNLLHYHANYLPASQSVYLASPLLLLRGHRRGMDEDLYLDISIPGSNPIVSKGYTNSADR